MFWIRRSIPGRFAEAPRRFALLHAASLPSRRRGNLLVRLTTNPAPTRLLPSLKPSLAGDERPIFAHTGGLLHLAFLRGTSGLGDAGRLVGVIVTGDNFEAVVVIVCFSDPLLFMFLLFRLLFRLLLLLPLLLLVSMHARRGAASLVVGTAEHLLLWGDPALTANTTLVPQTHPPAKTGTMVVLPDKPWENLIFAYTSVLKVSDTDYRIYYDAFGSQKNASHRFFCVATSTDGRVFTKPDLGLVAFQGSNATNIEVRGTAEAPTDDHLTAVIPDGTRILLMEEHLVRLKNLQFPLELVLNCPFHW